MPLNDFLEIFVDEIDGKIRKATLGFAQGGRMVLGGSGGPPGGFIGQLAQRYVTFDAIEAATLSGNGTLTDNLNRIRYRLGQLESTPSGGVSNFVALLDTPGDYVGQAGKYLVVNEEENALEFTTISGSGITGSGISSWADLLDKPTEFPPENHIHDDRYYTEDEVDYLLLTNNELVIVGDSENLVASNESYTNGGCFNTNDTFQQFTPDQSGYIKDISIRFSANYSGTLKLYLGETPTEGTLLYTKEISVTSGWGLIPLTTPIYVTSGTQYVWLLTNPGSCGPMLLFSDSNPYNGGAGGYSDGTTSYLISIRDYCFRVSVFEAPTDDATVIYSLDNNILRTEALALAEPLEMWNEDLTTQVPAVSGAYLMSYVPVSGTVRPYLNGLRQRPTDYTISGSYIVMNTLVSGDALLVDYRYNTV